MRSEIMIPNPNVSSGFFQKIISLPLYVALISGSILLAKLYVILPSSNTLNYPFSPNESYSCYKLFFLDLWGRNSFDPSEYLST